MKWGCIRKPRFDSEEEKRWLRKKKYEHLVKCSHLARRRGGSGWFCEKYGGYIDPRYGHGLCPAMKVS